jgi:hypothetical protein
MPPMDLNNARIRALGLKPGALALADASMRYAVGVVQRERERLARIFQNNGMSEIATSILDTSQDDNVFKWAGPETSLDVPPKPLPLADEK